MSLLVLECGVCSDRTRNVIFGTDYLTSFDIDERVALSGNCDFPVAGESLFTLSRYRSTGTTTDYLGPKFKTDSPNTADD